MTSQHTWYAYNAKTGDPASKLVLMMLSDCCDPDHTCYWDWDRLAGDCEMTPDEARRHVDSLVEKGFLLFDGQDFRFPLAPPAPPPTKAEKLLERLAKRDGRRCRYCGAEDGPFEIDHVHPRSRGGTERLANLAIACVPCNQSKSDKLLSEWVRI